MEALKEAASALRTAEQRLRAILIKSAELGQYEHLPQIAEWAKLLNAMLENRADETVLYQEPQSNEASYEPPAPAVSRADASPSRKTRSVRTKKKPRRSVVNSDYPKFLREGGLLVKIGWSKREKKPYEHKAPQVVLKVLVKALERVGAGGKRFTVDDLLPLKDEKAGTDIPDYQAYLVLAWLRSTELITQHGRQGYSLPENSKLERDSDRLWSELETR